MYIFDRCPEILANDLSLLKGDKLIFPKGCLVAQRNLMNNSLLCLMGAIFVLISVSLTTAIIQENSSIKEISNATSNNTILNNMTSNNASLNTSTANSSTSVNITKPKSIESMSSAGAKTSANLSTDQSEESNETFFKIGNDAAENNSSYKLDAPTLPSKNASYLWYIIQAKPHGMV